MDASDYEKVSLGSKIRIENVTPTLQAEALAMRSQIDNHTVEFKLNLTKRFRDILVAGGLLNYIKSKS
jgi:aconitate hydratase